MLSEGQISSEISFVLLQFGVGAVSLLKYLNPKP